MRQITATEKYNAVLEGSMAKREFVRQMRQQYPMYVSQFNGFDDTVQILKNRNMIYEASKPAFSGVKVYDDRPALTYSLDALERGIRIELMAAGKELPNDYITPEEYAKAEKKAKDNLEKDSNHYINLLSGESNNVDKHDREKEVKRGEGDIDTYNGLKKATLKEEVEEEVDPNPPMSEDAKKAMLGKVVGQLKAKYKDLITTNIIKDFLDMHYQDLLGGADIEDEFEEYLAINFEGPSDFPDVDEKKGKDHDGDGDIDSDDYLAARDKAIKKAMGKEEQLKEAIKTIIKKTLTENTINEAATNKLAALQDDFGGYEGASQVINQLENMVTEIEQFHTKTRDKIQKIYDSISKITNEEGLKIGVFIGPAIETAFRQDLRPVGKKGFTNGLELPKAKRLDPEIIARARAAGEIDETPEGAKETVFTPNF